MSSWPSAVLFDFDGVIVDSEPLHFRGFAEVAKDEGFELTEEEYFAELIGFDDRNGFAHLFRIKNRPLDAANLRRVMKRKSDIVNEMIAKRQFSALPGVDALIRGLRPHYPLAICSGALRGEIESMLDAIELRNCFQIIVAAEDVSVGKPDPQGYLLTAKLLGERIGKALPPKDCLIVEDAPTVIARTREVGFITLGVTTSHDAGALNAAGAHHVLDTLEPAGLMARIAGLKVG